VRLRTSSGALSCNFRNNYSLPKIHEQLSQAELLLDKHLVDAGYIEASNLVESQREKTKEFKEEYSKRAGVEGTVSQGVRAFGLRRSRYIGMGKTHLQHLATAAAINLKRVSDWLAGVDREKTRRSAFARVMQPLTA
jgi:Transposase DDE domain